MVFLLVGLALPFTAAAATPMLTFISQSGSNYQMTVTLADANASVNLYTREQGTTLWTVFHNVGTTDFSGYFSTNLMIGSFKSNVTREAYAIVNGKTSAIVSASSAGGSSSGNLSFSHSTVYLNQGTEASVTVYNLPANQSLYVASNSNSAAVSVAPSGSNSVSVYGIASGFAIVQVCAGAGSYCGSFSVSVAGGQASGLIFNPASVFLNPGASATVYVSGASGQNLYLASNPSPSMASVGVNNQNSITVYAINTGSTVIRMCASVSQICGNLTVTVNSSPTGQGGLSFVTATLPSGAVGNYYNAQLSASGGNAPYAFRVISGSLPAGLSLSSNGVLSGTPTARSQYFFTAQVTDYYGRQTALALSVEIFGGSVLGSATVQNGLIVQAGNTVYITYKNTKTPFASRSAFEGLGFRFAQISCRDCGYILDSGRTVWTAQTSHPSGAFIKSGQTVYFVHESGLIPISSYDVFLGNGGQDYLIVPMNGYDVALPRLAVMTYNDARLR